MSMANNITLEGIRKIIDPKCKVGEGGASDKEVISDEESEANWMALASFFGGLNHG